MTAAEATTPVRPGTRALLRWYEPRRRAYPWRRTTDPYAVLVSEVMLQQTQAARVVRAFERFLSAFPTIVDLAAASTSEVLTAWDGLGYNRRAVALQRAAREIVERHGGRVPSDPAELRRLHGVGRYTAAAVASIAFGVPVAAVDTNVRRVAARTFAGSDRGVDELASAWVHRARPGEWNQALMDLGREICRPVPRCTACPIRRSCASASGSERPEPERTARERTAARGEPAFAGSFRQLRGAIVRELRIARSASIASLAAATGRPMPEVHRAVASLARDGLVQAGAPMLRANDRVRLPD